MIKIVVSIDAYHEEYVKEWVDSLQKDGYTVIEIERVKRMFLGLIGKDITHIHYEK